jgi:hypothetical protein
MAGAFLPSRVALDFDTVNVCGPVVVAALPVC